MTRICFLSMQACRHCSVAGATRKPKMTSLLAGIVILGVILGLAFRFLSFAIVAVIVVAVVTIGSSATATGAMLLNAVLAAVGLQVGYVLGLVARALYGWLRGRIAALNSRRRSRDLRYPRG
jgi:hypothetical protein